MNVTLILEVFEVVMVGGFAADFGEAQFVGFGAKEQVDFGEVDFAEV